MDMRHSYLVQILFLIFATHHTNGTLYLNIPQTTVSVKEKEARRLALTPESDPIICRDTTDGDLTRALLQSLTPSAPCFRCFTIEPCGNRPEKQFCLIFQSSQGELDYNQISSYTALITCTDDKETPLTRSIEISVVRNLPPAFKPAVLFETADSDLTRSRDRGFDVHTVATTDDENDAVFFSMYTSPPTDLFEIGYSSGVIKAAKNLRSLCFTPVSFYVTMWDQYHNPVGPKVIQVNFLNRNDPPKITNTDHTVTIAEDATPGDRVATIDVTDTTTYPDITISFTSEPEGGLDLYRVFGRRIQVRRALDYEYEALREVTLTVTAFDGFCYSDPYVVRVVITDVNEPLVLQPIFIEPTVFEGFVKYTPNLTVVDPDGPETHTFTKVSGSNKLIVEATTGLISSDELIDIDPKDKKNLPVKILVEDTGGHSERLEVNFTVVDLNDNMPVFIKVTFEFKVDNCTEVGEIVGKLLARDDDSKLYGNNLLVYSGSGASFVVLSDGSVLYTSLLNVGDVDAGFAYVTDQGLFPGPLSGTPAVVTVTCDVCKIKQTETTTAATTTVTEWTGPRNAEASEILRATDTSTNDRSWSSNNMTWISAAAVLLLALAVAVGLVLRQQQCLTRTALPKHVKGGQAGGDKTAQLQDQGQRNGKGPDTQNSKQKKAQQRQRQQQQQPDMESQPQQQHQPGTNKPRSEIPVMADDADGVPMHPPALPYPQAFQETEQPLPSPKKPAGRELQKKGKQHTDGKDKEKKEKKTKQTVTGTKQPKHHKTQTEHPNQHKTQTEHPNQHKTQTEHPNQHKTQTEHPKQHKTQTEHPEQHKTRTEQPEQHKTRTEQPRHHKKELTPAVEKTPSEISRKPQMHVGEYIDLEIVTPRASPLPLIQ